MVVRAEGVLRSGHIDLQTPVTDLPEGARVIVELRPRELSLVEKRQLVDELCGSWADDPTLGPILEEIDQQRHEYHGRPVNLDDPPGQ